MATQAIVGARMEVALQGASAIIKEHGSEARHENLKELEGHAIPNLRRPDELAQYQAEMLAALAEIVRDQKLLIAGLAERLDNLENPPAAVAGKGKKV